MRFLSFATLIGLTFPFNLAQAQTKPLSSPIFSRNISPFAGKSLEQKVQELADREEIRQLTAVYAQRVAHGVSIADLFTEDAVWTMRRSPDGPADEVRGMAMLKERFPDQLPRNTSTVPMIHNFILDVDGDQATGMNTNDLRLSQHGQDIEAWGQYRDVYQRVNGRWLFARRDMTFRHFAAQPAKAPVMIDLTPKGDRP